jgi:hypothetical protein
MKTHSTKRSIIAAIILTGFIMISGSSFAQQESDNKPATKKTITIHVTKEVNGKTTVIDTTVVTDGDFDADAFLAEKGVMNDASEQGSNKEKKVIICHPGAKEFSWSDSESSVPDTLYVGNDTIIMLSEESGMPAPPPGKSFDYNFNMPVPPPPGMTYDYDFDMPAEFPHMEGMQFGAMMEELARSLGLENVMPFGEMKEVVVKKKRNGKKVIITFENRDEMDKEHANVQRKEEKVYIYSNVDRNKAPQNEERIIIEGQPGERIIINKNVDVIGDEKTINVKTEVDKAEPVKVEKKVIIIKEEKSK